jgi:hypothetical protein
MPGVYENMNMRKIGRLVCLALISLPVPLSAAAEDVTNAIHAYLQHCIEAERISAGAVVGIVDESGSRIISFGRLDNGLKYESANLGLTPSGLTPLMKETYENAWLGSSIPSSRE